MTNKFTKAIRSVVLGAMVGLNFLPSNANAGDISGNIGYIQREKAKTSYAEANTFYQLPLGVNGFTFLDFYNQNGGFFGKTTLTREIAESGISAKVQAVHGNELCTGAGFGLEAKLPTQKGITAKVNCTPLWINSDGKEADTLKVGYFVAVSLPKDMTLSSFGEANVADLKAMTWCYGEVELAKQIGKLSISYNAGLSSKGTGKATPEIKHGVAVRYNF